ncbi:MAG: FtsX-like permease family protein [Chloroflexi bacterium]|nr:FtsX-like permease family protein [Chloroflexota bacterium]
MAKTRIRKIMGDILSRKGRTALVSMSIFIGVFGVVTLFTMGDLIVNRLENDIQEDKLAMMKTHLTLAPDATPIANDALLSQVQAYPGVTTTEGYLSNLVYFQASENDKFEEGAVIASYAPIGQSQLEPMRLIEGDYPTAGQRQLAVEQRMAEEYGLQVGDTLNLRMVSLAGGGAEIPVEAWTISAIVFQPYQLDFGYDPTVSVFATFEDAQYITGVSNVNYIFTRFTSYKLASQQADAFATSLAETTGYIPDFNYTADPAKNDQVKSATDTSNVLGMLGLTALIVSGFLVINVVNSIVIEQKRQIGVMKSLGASRGDNFFMYIGIALTYGILGVVPGVIAGIPAGYLAAQALATTMGTIIESFTLAPRAILLGISVGLAVPVLAALIPVFNGTRVKILDAMLDLGISSKYGSGFMAKLITKLPVSINVRQGISNVSQKKGRLTFTVLTLAMAAGAFMGIFALFSSINGVLDTIFDTYSGTDIYISPTQQQDFNTIKTVLAENVDGIDGIEPVSGLQVEIEGYTPPASNGGTIFANGYDPEAEQPAFSVDLREGSLWGEGTDPYGVVLSSSIADAMGVKAGDTITISGAGNTREVEVVGIAKYPFDQVFMRWQALSDLAGYTVNDQPVARDIAVVMSEDDPTVKQADDKIDEINEALLSKGITASYQNFPEIVKNITSMINSFQMIFNLTAALIALVGGLGLLTALSMSVFERQKEIGVMRSIGASSRVVVSQFLTEGIIVGVIAWAVGLPISYLLSIALTEALGLGDTFKLSYPITAPIIGLIGMMIVTTISSLWPSLSAARKTVSDILRYQ